MVRIMLLCGRLVYVFLHIPNIAFLLGLYFKLSWRDGVELQHTSSSGRATSAQNTGESSDTFRHPVAGSAVKQAFVSSNARMKKDNDFQASVFRPRNAPVRVSVSGEWALQECRVCN